MQGPSGCAVSDASNGRNRATKARSALSRQSSATNSCAATKTNTNFPSFLLAHCGGGQDKPGFLGPSAETPALIFCGRCPGSIPSKFNEIRNHRKIQANPQW